VSTQSEGAEVSEGDPVSGFSSSSVVTKAGKINVSQQFLDRAGPGVQGDQVLFQQIKEQLDAQVDVFAITQALANAQEVNNAAAFTLTSASGVGGFVGDLKKAKNKLHDLQGQRLRGTHCFAIGDFVDHISSYADAQGRPVFSPSFDDNRLPIRSTGDTLAEGYSGYVLVGLALVADDNIPNLGTTGFTQIIVTRPETILLLEGPAVPYCYPPSLANQLDAVLGLRSYVAVVLRFKEAVSTITGKTYEASQFA
jgi:hypothetical protein